MEQDEYIEHLKRKIVSENEADRVKYVDELINIQGTASVKFVNTLFFEPEGDLHDVAGYALRKIRQKLAEESVEDFKYCPYCASQLEQYALIDPYMIGLRCANNHRFHIETIQDEPYLPETYKDLCIDSDNPVIIAKGWLQNPAYRKYISSNQVAEILRTYVEMSEGMSIPDAANDTYTYCPICSSTFENVNQEEAWAKGLKCANGHRLLTRNGLSWQLKHMDCDLNRKSFNFLVKAYATKEGQGSFLPNQLVKLLWDIAEAEIQLVTGN